MTTVLVTGAPGAGKTTLALPLAARLGFALLAKDDIKETLHDELGWAGDTGPDGDLVWSRRLGGAAMGVLWRLAERCPAVVLEATFRPRGEYERLWLPRLRRPLVEVWCDCPPAECARRYAARHRDRHATHVVRELTPELLAEFDGPLGVGTLVRVDTSGSVDVADVAVRVAQALGSATVRSSSTS